MRERERERERERDVVISRAHLKQISLEKEEYNEEYNGRQRGDVH